jgi:hypothetical protein
MQQNEMPNESYNITLSYDCEDVPESALLIAQFTKLHVL